MKVLITGGAGFIGSHLADHLLDRGDDVLIIDNFATGRRDNLREHPNSRLIEGTIADSSLLDGALAEFQPDYVVHAAASYKNPENYQEDVQTNALGSALLAQLSVRYGVRRLIYFQTALCYGISPLEQPITLNHPLCPGDSSYALSKTAGEWYIALSGVDFISFRLANAYGPRNMSGPLPTFYHRLTNNKSCFVKKTRRDFIFVEDLIEVVLKALSGAGSKGFYHVASGTDYSIKELFDHTVDALGISLDKPVEEQERDPGDAGTILLDPSRTNLDFDWRIRTGLATGVAKAVEYYKGHGISETYTHLKQE